MTPLEKAVEAGGMVGWDHIEDRIKAAIRAFLEAAAEDRPTAEGVWSCAYDTWAEFGASDHDGGKAAILALKETLG